MSALFPELDAPELPPAPAPSPTPATAQARAIVAPPACVERFSRALALPAPVTAVHLRGEDIRIVTEVDGAPRAIFITPPGARAWRRAPGFGVAVEGATVDPAVARALEGFVARYRTARFDAFREIIYRALDEASPEPPPPPPQDPASTAWTEAPRRPSRDAASTAWSESPTGAARSPAPWNDHDGSRAARLEEPDDLRLRSDQRGALFFSYGARAAWRTFFEDHDLYRGGCSHVEGRVATVMHREVECAYNLAPATSWGRGSFGALADDPGEASSGAPSMLLDTDLGDRDVILGGDARLDAAFDAIAAMPARPDLVLVQSTCVPVVTGDDLEASAERARRKHRLPIAVLGYLEHPHASAVVQLLDQITPGLAGPAAVLLGMPRVEGLRELQQLLRDCGATLLGPLIPDFPREARDALERAGVLVTYDEPHTRNDVARVVERLRDRAVIAPPAPFDPATSHAFCRAVAAALGLEASLDARWDALRPAWEPRWTALTARAARFTLGFVSDVADWPSRLQRRLGVPLLDTVRAMGFAVEVLAWAPQGASPAASDDPAVTVRPFASQNELEALLRASPAALFYSEVRYDRRVQRTGHGSFSLEDLRAGPVGATEALQSLLARCETPWFRRHGRRAGAAFNEPRRG